MTGKTRRLPLWEVFIRNKRGLDHKHAGSIHAADGEQALQYARDTLYPPQRGVAASGW